MSTSDPSGYSEYKRKRKLPPKPRKAVWEAMSQENKDKVLANLTGKQFKPGQSGNPGGMPKGEFNLDRALRMRLSNAHIRARLVENLIERALAGDQLAMKLVVERTGGALMKNVLDIEAEREAGEKNARTVLFNDEIDEEAKELQPAIQAENEEDEE